MAKPKTTPPSGAEKQTPPGKAGQKPKTQTSPMIKDMAHEIIANSLAKEANGEVLRWRWHEATMQLVVLLKDGRKLYGQLVKD